MSPDDSGLEDEGGDAQISDDADNGNEEHGGAERGDEIDGISPSFIREVLEYWVETTGIPLEKLVRTTYRKVESDVGKVGGAENERVVELAGKIGGGW